MTTPERVLTRTYEIEARTNIWTGDLQGKPDRLITTGLLGSIRWWFEVVVRGLGGKPCDPSPREHNTPCPADKRKTPHDPGHHCVVCELFGCTGWARKFRFDVLDEGGQAQREQITEGQKFKLCLTPLRSICEEEWALLDLTLRLIAEYGVLGGKTVFKPTEESHRDNEKVIHHHDFGLISLFGSSGGAQGITSEKLRDYVNSSRWHGAQQDGMAWASLMNFWAVREQYLARQDADKSTFNQVLGRVESKGCRDCGAPHDPPAKCPRAKPDPKRNNRLPAPHRNSESMSHGVTAADRWLAGDQRVSKKVFSFKNPSRTFGFINPNGGNDQVTLEEIKKRLGAAWQRTIVEEEVAAGDTSKIQLLTGHKILECLLRAQEVKS